MDKVGFKLRTCRCVCPKAVLELAKNISLSNAKANNSDWTVQKNSQIITKKPEVKSMYRKSVIRRKTSARDQRASSTTFGVIALVCVGFELFVFTAGDALVAAVHIKRKLVHLLCPTVRLEEQPGQHTSDKSIQRDEATLHSESTNAVDLEEKPDEDRVRGRGTCRSVSISIK